MPSSDTHVCDGIQPPISSMPPRIRAQVDGKSWTPPAVFKWLAKCSRAGEAEMLRTFNCGIGMVLVVGASDAKDEL